MGFSIAGGYAVFSDYITVVAFPNDGDNAWHYDYSQIAFYDASAKDNNDWGSHSKDWYVMSQHMAYQSISDEQGNRLRTYVDLGREGQITLSIPSLSKKIEEYIPDAGVEQPWSKNYGYVTCVKEIGSHLYVCGDNNQVYRRSDAGVWEHIDRDILQSDSPNFWTFLSDINGIAEDDIYAVGNMGCIYHYNSREWGKIDHNVGENGLKKIKIMSKDDVYIVGRDGIFIKGNARDGFRDVLSSRGERHYTDIEYFNDLFYLASSEGMFIFDPSINQLSSYNTDLEVDLLDTYKLSVKDGVLWSIGIKDIAWFNGNRWVRVDIPGNPKIGSNIIG